MPAAARRSTVTRKIRSAGGGLIRRLGLVPAGTPDALGEDGALVGEPWPYEVMVYFADTTEALYQIAQWYRAFEALDRKHRVVVVTRDSRTARRIREDSALDVHTIAHYTTLDDILGRSSTKLALYVNHNPENFTALRFGTLVHASLMHGDSDKLVSVSNQTKAYDFSFVAGQAAVERMARYSTLFDAPGRCIPVGRPQLDEQSVERERIRAARRVDVRPTVLYAPTWEGGQPSAEYGSVVSHGMAMLRALVESGRYRVIYRPHPLTGVRDAAYGDADAALREYLEDESNRADPLGRHFVDTGDEPAVAFGEADLLVCDISGVAMDWLATGLPLVVTKPVGDVVVARSALTELAPRVTAAEAGSVVGLADRELAEDPTRTARLALREQYLGDTTPGASTHRFIEACERLFEIRDEEVARVRAGDLPTSQVATTRRDDE